MYATTTLLALLSTLTLGSSRAVSSPRAAAQQTWTITDFHASSAAGGSTSYGLSVSNGYAASSCVASNSVMEASCPGASSPAAFDNTTCTDTEGASDAYYWSWSLSDAESATVPQTRGLSLKIALTQLDQPPLYGCRFFDYNVTCVQDPNNPSHASAGLVAPSSFELTPTEESECIYG